MNIINNQNQISSHDHCEFFNIDENDPILEALENLDFKSIAESSEIKTMNVLNYFFYECSSIDEEGIDISFGARYDNSFISIDKCDNEYEDSISLSWYIGYLPSDDHEEQLEKIRSEVLPELINKLIQLNLN